MDRAVLQLAVERADLLFLGVVALELEEDFHRYRRWLEEGRQAGMEYLEKNQALRSDPSQLLPRARSAILFALPYGQRDLGPKPRVAQYGRFRDYHKILWEKGEAIAKTLFGEEPESFRVVVDSAPVLERALAASSSRGFIGKNTCFIHPEHGSYLLLGEILTTLDLTADERSAPKVFESKSREGGCGPCKQCQVACPTGALDDDYRIDARRCLAYWTIEHRGAIPEEFWPHLKEYYFGCDLCQTACPYNGSRAAQLPSSISLRDFPPLFDVAVMSESEYQRFFGGTPLTRAKREGLRRNALIALTVSGDPRLPEALRRAELDPLLAETISQIRRYSMANNISR